MWILGSDLETNLSLRSQCKTLLLKSPCYSRLFCFCLCMIWKSNFHFWQLICTLLHDHNWAFVNLICAYVICCIKANSFVVNPQWWSIKPIFWDSRLIIYLRFFYNTSMGKIISALVSRMSVSISDFWWQSWYQNYYMLAGHCDFKKSLWFLLPVLFDFIHVLSSVLPVHNCWFL